MAMNTLASQALVAPFLSLTFPLWHAPQNPSPINLQISQTLLQLSSAHLILYTCLGNMSKYRYTLISEVAGTQWGIKLKSGPDKSDMRVSISPSRVHQFIFIASDEFGPDCLTHFNLMTQNICGKTFSRVSILRNGFASRHMVFKKRIKSILLLD